MKVPSRRCIPVLALTAAMALTACSPGGETPEIRIGAQVGVTSGQLAGAEDGNVVRFRGIPYAAATHRGPPLGAPRARTDLGRHP